MFTLSLEDACFILLKENLRGIETLTGDSHKNSDTTSEFSLTFQLMKVILSVLWREPLKLHQLETKQTGAF